ncbi:MAG: selenide, water dikinase SelD [Candidatus Cloacimonetes bacterium]|nr:selenide, water dikinase SelD [Candidatus Cloacimonadota bacterium]
MQGLQLPANENLLLGTGSSDDAGIYRLNDELALVQTVDIITPVVDDPFLYGQIAAANSMSDVWAMGGRMLTALNIVAYDNCHLTLDDLREILAGGADKVREAGGVILGGHTIEDPEMKYGLSVTGLVHPDKFLRNNSIQAGDVIILTKPLGMGVITTSIKGEMADEKTIKEAAFHMAFLNKYAAEAALESGVNAMTDVTGFGMLGHLHEMTNEKTSLIVDYPAIPMIAAAYELAEYGLFPAGAHRNADHYQQYCNFEIDLPDSRRMLLFDPQTSGGLLLSIKEEKAQLLLDKLHDLGIEIAGIIASVSQAGENKIIIRG